MPEQFKKTCVFSKSSLPSIMHDRVVIIWAVEIVCHLLAEVMNVVCQNNKKGHLVKRGQNRLKKKERKKKQGKKVF